MSTTTRTKKRKRKEKETGFPIITSLTYKESTKSKLKMGEHFTNLFEALNDYLIKELIELITMYYENVYDLLMYLLKSKCETDSITNKFQMHVCFNPIKDNNHQITFIIFWFYNNSFMLQGDVNDPHHYKILNINANQLIIKDFFQKEINKNYNQLLFVVCPKGDENAEITKIDFGNSFLNNYIDKSAVKSRYETKQKQYMFKNVS